MLYLVAYLFDIIDLKRNKCQKALEASVPAADLETANRQYAALTARYRDLLAQQAAESTASRTLQVGLNSYTQLGLN